MKGLHLYDQSNLFSSIEQSTKMLPSEVSPMWDILNWQLAYQKQLYQQRISIYHHPVIMSQLKQSDQVARLYVYSHTICNSIYTNT